MEQQYTYHQNSYLMELRILLIKTSNKPLGEFMKRINMLYAIYFNKKYSYIGHLYQDRYYCELIEDDKQMLETSTYIHLNPVRARMVNKPEDYQWSSYKEFIGTDEVTIIKPDKVLNYFKKEYKHKLYQKFVENKIKQQKEENLSKQCGGYL